MNIYPEIKKIAGLNQRISNLEEKIKQQIDVEGMDWKAAYLVAGCSEKKGHLYCNGSRLDNCGLVDDIYYCRQYTGWCEDDFYGTLYFKTDVPGQFVAVPFAM